MKKTIIFAAIACVALASCVKNEQVFSGGKDVAIGFSPISQKTATKAVYYGEQNATYTGDGSTYEKFLAFAAYTEDNTTVPSINFFPAAGAECEYEPTGYPAGSDFWAPASLYYWPKSGYLTFRAFSPSALTPYSGDVTNNWATGITISNFVASTNMDKQVDVLYSDVNAYRTRGQYTPESGFTYDETSGDIGTHNGVDIVFHHALSAVQFRVVTEEDYTPQTSFKVTKIEVLNANYKGEFHENRDGSTYDKLNVYQNAPGGSVTKNKDYNVGSTPYWTPTAAEITDYTVFSGSQVVNALANVDATTKDFGLYGKLMLPMPQTLGSHGASLDKDVIVKVTYDYSFKAGTTTRTYTGRTTEISLAGKTAAKYDGNTEDYTVNQWLINHKYLYTLKFKLDPIIFDPSVEAWVEVTDINIDLPYQN